MIEWYRIYTDKRIDCKYCKKAKELLLIYGVNFHEIDVSEPGVKEMFAEKGFKTVPQVFIEDKHIGGFSALEHHLRSEQLVKEQEYKRSQGRLSAGEVGTSEDIKF